MAYYNIDPSKHYYLWMHPLESIPGFITYTCSSSREYLVECEVVEEQYKLSDDYKVELRALDKSFGKETFYQSSFCSMLKSGYIREKTSDKCHVEEVKWMEHLCGDAYLVHSAFTLVEE